MITTATTDSSIAARAAALFVSTLSVADGPTDAQVRAAVARALVTHGGTQGCTAELAAAYGDHPELAAPRMRWARNLVERAYATPAPIADRLALAA